MKYLVTITLLISLSFSQFLSEDEKFESFKLWKATHGKFYETIEEHEKRREIFSNTLNIINEHNSKGKSWKMGLNEYSDLTHEEWKGLKLGGPLRPHN